jgi:adenosine deaminase
MSDLLLRHLTIDRRTLAVYLSGKFPKPDDVKSNLFLAEREVQYSLPDHYYRNIATQYFLSNESLANLITTAFTNLVQDKSVWRADRLHIRLERFGDWHDLITRFPPLPLIAYAIFREYGHPDGETESYDRFLQLRLLPNLGDTALIGPFHPVLDDLARIPGLFDLHQHLNGTTEADLVWLRALQRPYDLYLSIRESYESKTIIREQFSSFEPGLSPNDTYERLCIAALLRCALIDHLFHGPVFTLGRMKSIAAFGLMPNTEYRNLVAFHDHPLRWYISDSGRYDSLPLEGLFHILAFRYLHGQPSRHFVHAYHLYLLLHGTFCQLIVQQHEQFGFDQFQRIAENDFRTDSERDYERRFRQIKGDYDRGLTFIEGRFAPKQTVSDNRSLLSTILSGYAQYCGFTSFDYDRDDFPDIPSGLPKLRLVAHFIKKQDQDERHPGSLMIRHQRLRTSLEEQGKALLTSYTEDRHMRRFLVGIDAAANELHAPPEVFAPLYRRYRRNGFVNFTFHVGEDFVHLLSGLRSIWEAVVFLGLSCGNRIGHATAVGIVSEFWLQAVGRQITISRLEWIDNLTFAYFLLQDIPEGQQFLEQLREEIEVHCRKIYEGNRPVSLLIDAWHMRDVDPLLACGIARSRFDSIDWRDRVEWEKVDDARLSHPDAFTLYSQYQSLASSFDRDMITVTDDLVGSTLLELVQMRVLKVLHDKGIVIETMPTSNVRICFYRKHHEHHIWRWLNGDGHQKPTLCVASDDPGIFATNLYNEYAHIFQGLMTHQEKSLEDTTKIMTQLAENGRRYHFEVPGEALPGQ